MRRFTHTRQWITPMLFVASMSLAGLGCSSSDPKPMAQPSVQDVRGNADRAFEKLKQEEQQREQRPAPTGY